ncbi:hypothetical protein ACS0TY_029103 [Phlomoides rotata]
MIKRRFYRLDHSNRDAASGSDSSSSDSYLEPEASDESHETEIEDGDEEENVVSDVRVKGEASSSSGYESEDSSVNEVNLDSSGLPTSDDDAAAQNGVQNMLGSFADVETNSLLAGAHNSPEKDGKTDFDTADCVIKCKSVFKCRLCPRIVCLSEDTIKAHLSSKRHARSEKLRKEGRLKLMLNDDGKLEGEIPADEDATTFPGQKAAKPNKRGKGREKQRKRPRQDSKWGKSKREKKRKNDD